MPITENQLITFMKNDLGVDTSDVQPDTPLFSSGLIDSFSLVGLITFIESSSDVKVDPMDVNLDNFDTVGSILAYTQRAETSR